MKGAGWIALVAISVAITLFFEWHTDEVTVVLAVMCLLAVIVGAGRPKLAPVSGAAIGFSIFVAHALSESTGAMRPHYMHSAPRVGDWIAMAIAGAFVTAVAWVGGRIRVAATSETSGAAGNP